MKWLKKNWLYIFVPLSAVAIGYELALISGEPIVTQSVIEESQANQEVSEQTELNIGEAQNKRVVLLKEQLNPTQIIQLTNKYRATKGLVSLTENAQLDQSACLKAQDMVAKNYWAHVSPDGLQPQYWVEQVGYHYYRLGENLAYGFRTSNDVMSGWEKSPEHEANLSGDYTETGVCVLYDQSYMGGLLSNSRSSLC